MSSNQNCKGETVMYEEPIKAMYEKYKHMDNLFSDKGWIATGDFKYHVISDLWIAIKESLNG